MPKKREAKIELFKELPIGHIKVEGLTNDEI
jgi:hypothetical protein